MRKLMGYRRIKGRPVAVQKRDEAAPASAAPVGDVLHVLVAPRLVDTREDVPPSRSDHDPVDRLPDDVQSRSAGALRRLYVTGDTDPAATPHRNAGLQGRTTAAGEQCRPRHGPACRPAETLRQPAMRALTSCGWPAASPDTCCGRRAISKNNEQHKIRLIDVCTFWRIAIARDGRSGRKGRVVYQPRRAVAPLVGTG
jgi:hypothetical protein